MDIIQNNKEKEILLDFMFNTNSAHRYGLSSLKILNALKYWLIDLPTVWTRREWCDSGIKEREWCKSYQERVGIWRHKGAGYAHNETGMAWAEYNFRRGIDIGLSDSPDISGLMDNKAIMGDVGRCSWLAALNGIGSLGLHDLWITVRDYREIIVEFFYSPGRWIYGKGASELVEESFYCLDHNQWHIDGGAKKPIL